ncbi:multidrug efflux system outer membrane protein [Stella humosa]|uniref:Multidrug efflux system outer membrane protein n=1 Tax=Stella humosa TaxID=94 RepID=A0A3N1KR74_9PROT|nr:efflux transporter outer membrane subunit [Stella humosa]ROP80840.1 multidrug efflux system outer membrane protein [Stella humosa]BBK33368.1 adeC/adeK/oprM family multidrug efflux complex outer membrane factor [Stella humosa]
MPKSLLSLAALGAVLAGCSLAPAYERPAAPVASFWPFGSGQEKPSADAAAARLPPAADIGWRGFFQDPRLQGLIAAALANNRDLRIAALNVEAARAQYQIESADLLPSVNGTAGATMQRTPGALSPAGRSTTSQTYSVGLGLTAYEVDLFGRIRSLRDTALETYFSLDQTRTAAQISLVSQVANAYLTLLADAQLLRLTRETLASQRESYELTRASYDRGVATELDLRQVETLMRTAETNISIYNRRLATDRNQLEFLTGQPLPEDFVASLGDGEALDRQGMLADLPAGLPSDLLERRPDIRSAEYDLRAANANIGAARAAFFPRITLTAGIGTASTSLDGLFRAGSSTWNFLPSISVPIFDAGANQAGLDLARVRRNIQVAQYEKAIQNAFGEVADALAIRATYDTQIRSQEALVAANEQSFRLADMRYRSGIDSYLATLVNQRALYQSQQELILMRLARLSNLVILYKVLGGGWTAETMAGPAPVPPAPPTMVDGVLNRR